jgi:hypothetical protein
MANGRAGEANAAQRVAEKHGLVLARGQLESAERKALKSSDSGRIHGQALPVTR